MEQAWRLPVENLIIPITEPTLKAETSASSTFFKMKYIGFIALSLMSVQAGKIFQLFFISTSYENHDLFREHAISAVNHNDSTQYAFEVLVQKSSN